MIKKILVTGANGYIGTVLTEKLYNQGRKVTGWDTDYFKEVILGTHKNKYLSKKIDIRQKDINLSNFDCIIHLAALSNDPIGALDEKLTYEINHRATINLAKNAKKMGVKRFIFSSSCSVYGIAKDNIVNEESAINPLTAYAKSKALVEEDLKKLADDNFCVCLLRNATVYGFSPRFRNDLVVNNLVTCGMSLGEIRVLSDGTPWRPLIDIRDLCDIFLKFVDVDSKSINGDIFNVGFSDSNLMVKEILKFVKKYLPDCQIKFTLEHGKDTRSYKVDFKKMKKLFPNVKQSWFLDKSIHHLIRQLNRFKFTKTDFETKRFERLTSLQTLMFEQKLNKKLYWKSD